MSERELIDMQQVHLFFIDDLYEDECIMMRCETVRLKTDAYARAIDALDQSALKKLSSESRTNH